MIPNQHYFQFAVNNNPPNDIILGCSNEDDAYALTNFLQNVQSIGGQSVNLTVQQIVFSPQVGLRQAQQEILGGC